MTEMPSCVLPLKQVPFPKTAPLPPDESAFKSIDLNRAARTQYGAGARAVKVGSHLYDWRARLKGKDHPLDLVAAVREQHGHAYLLVAVGLKAADWRALELLTPRPAILPVLIVAAEHVRNSSAVSKALGRYGAVIERTRTWYAGFVGRTFRPLRSIVVLSDRTGKDWNDLSERSKNDDERFRFWDEARIACERTGLTPAAGWILAVSVFSGASPDVSLGAAGTPTWVVLPPRSNSVACPATGPLNGRAADAAYALGHELGHAFGLGHTCDVYPGANCGASIMQYGKPPEAILTPGELSSLAPSPYFT